MTHHVLYVQQLFFLKNKESLIYYNNSFSLIYGEGVTQLLHFKIYLNMFTLVLKQMDTFVR